MTTNMTTTCESDELQLYKGQDFTMNGEIENDNKIIYWQALFDGHGNDSCIHSIRQAMKNHANEIILSEQPLQKIQDSIDETEDIGKLSWHINDLLDQFEAFSRDVNTSLAHTSEGKTYRRVLTLGLHGDLIKYSNNVNSALDIIATSQSKDEFIQNMLSILNEYQEGNYSNSIDTKGMQEDIIGLANGINELGNGLSELSQINFENGLTLRDGAITLSENVDILTKSSNEQAASIEETSATLEEISSNMKSNNDNTAELSKYTELLIKSAKDGGDCRRLRG